MSRAIRIYVERLHYPLGALGVHEWQVVVRRGDEQLSNPPAFGRGLAECVRRAVRRAREQLRAEQLGMTGWPACGEVEADDA
jgi:hypothetical protein